MFKDYSLFVAVMFDGVFLVCKYGEIAVEPRDLVLHGFVPDLPVIFVLSRQFADSCLKFLFKIF